MLVAGCIMEVAATSVKKTFTTDSKKTAKSTAPLTTLEPGTFGELLQVANTKFERPFRLCFSSSVS